MTHRKTSDSEPDNIALALVCFFLTGLVEHTLTYHLKITRIKYLCSLSGLVLFPDGFFGLAWILYKFINRLQKSHK